VKQLKKGENLQFPRIAGQEPPIHDNLVDFAKTSIQFCMCFPTEISHNNARSINSEMVLATKI
jgi:hypothetical protein